MAQEIAMPKTMGTTLIDVKGLKVHFPIKGGLLSRTVSSMAHGARDFRDTVHVNAEVRNQTRARREDAEVLLAVVRLISRDRWISASCRNGTEWPGRKAAYHSQSPS